MQSASSGRLPQDKGITSDMPTPPANNSSFTFADALAFMTGEWQRVWATKESLERRAITLITTSGVLVTLAFGFTTAVAKGKGFSNFTHAERIVLVVSLVFFAFSALIALIVNLPNSHAVPDFSDVLGIGTGPISPEPLKRLDDALQAGHAENDSKAVRLTLAFCAQLIAIATLAVVVGMVTG
jgi:hypothetical protein